MKLKKLSKSKNCLKIEKIEKMQTLIDLFIIYF
jgi:hypothetical protein